MGLVKNDKLSGLSLKFLESLFILILLSCSQKKTVDRLPEMALDSIGPATNDGQLREEPKARIRFSTIKILDGLVELQVPSNFEIMNETVIATKYPSKVNTKFCVYTNLSQDVNVTFEQTSNLISMQELSKLKIALEKQLLQSGMDLLSSRIVKINGREAVVFETVAFAVDTEIYNLMLATSLDNKLFIVTFNCPGEKLKAWQPTAEQIIYSMRINE